MKLYTFILTLCVCVLYARAASIPCEKNIDDLANVDLDDVAVQPELTDHTPVKDVDNNLRKTIVDIPVKVVEEPTVLDENSNDYVPKDDENIAIKRLEIDLSNPGTPQRQEHETQNPENHGELEKALFGIKKSVIDAQNSFNEGFKEVSNSFKSVFGANENLPDVHQKLDNLRHSFTNQIEKLHETIKSNLKSDKVSEEKLKTAESYLENLKKNFNAGIDTLTEGVEVLTIIREEDEAVKTTSVINTKDGAVKADGATASSSEATPTQTQTSPTNGLSSFLTNFQNGISSLFSNFNQAIQNNLPSNQGSSNPVINFFQGLSLPNINQGQKPINSGSPNQNAAPADAQADSVPATSVITTSAPWGPQAFLQQVQNTWQNLVNPGQNIQQDTPQPQQPAQQPINNGPIAQAIHNIGQFILRPSQAFTQQPQQQPQQQQPQQQQPQQLQPQQQQPQQQPQPQQPTTGQGAASDSASAPSETPQNEVPQADASLAVPAKADAIPATPPQAQASVQPVQNGPIQQLVQNNPIIKGIQSAVQRLQGTPNPETPRNDIINEENKENTKLKGIHGSQGNGGDNNSSGVEVVKEEQKEEDGIVKCNAEVLEEIKSEVAKLPSPSDKTE
ncbi:unnamed protein product [Euphydryas editha]|nr:unnamed protein product [Euphydryas editha]